jgi:hypothetical protein
MIICKFLLAQKVLDISKDDLDCKAVETLDILEKLMRNISWQASCFSKIKKPNKHCSGNQSVIIGVCILTRFPIFILK